MIGTCRTHFEPKPSTRKREAGVGGDDVAQARCRIPFLFHESYTATLRTLTMHDSNGDGSPLWSETEFYLLSGDGVPI